MAPLKMLELMITKLVSNTGVEMLLAFIKSRVTEAGHGVVIGI